ncbi:CDP-alcohol phosphatidyltransferase family protein [Paenarthrobacter sp. DKR-5]|uniref:CDP-alcohol phosphatidyltransferase family protein n=1 Tax=Paenarthrobacter sp. DKR-5 TaxID=2835535 RepID=UPI001BDDBDFD|nr:CDP-alcohol phosphatidyltransferase family protein [Paenarthrobacter sp. DKR-5]MBT1001193.1 CDP-alcohol phosphatidyltransferase family protein [Paenarthrobacter sp. DKR-5]
MPAPVPAGARLRRALPNALTVLRIILLPVFLWLLLGARSPERALAALVIIGLSDWADGFLARRWHVVSRFGATVDPLADRLTVLVVLGGLGAAGYLFWWVLLLVLVPDVVLALTAALLFRGPPALEVSRLGKWRTAFLLAGLPTVLLGNTAPLLDTPVSGAGLLLVLAGIAGHLLAAAQYTARMVRLRRATGQAEGPR